MKPPLCELPALLRQAADWAETHAVRGQDWHHDMRIWAAYIEGLTPPMLAAPDMLAALKAVQQAAAPESYTLSGGKWTAPSEALALVEAALAKAEGRE